MAAGMPQGAADFKRNWRKFVNQIRMVVLLRKIDSATLSLESNRFQIGETTIATPDPPATRVQMKLLTPFPILAVTLLCASFPAQANEIVIVSENFGGTSATNLQDKDADVFAPAIITSGGNKNWAEDVSTTTIFKQDGSTVTISSTTARSIYLNLGSYINDAKGTSSGLFELAISLNKPVVNTTTGTATDGLFSFGFSGLNSPAGSGGDFTSSAVGGIATMAYRENGDLDMWAGTLSTNEVAANDTILSGIRSLTVKLDLRNWDGSTNFGSVSFWDNATELGSFAYTSDVNFGSILLSARGSVSATAAAFANLTLTQINPAADAPPVLTITPATSPATGYDLQWDSETGKAYNLRTSTDLAGPIGGWDIIQGDITATPPLNVVNVPVDGPRRFYAIEEFDVP
jgi:hypothetical protein